MTLGFLKLRAQVQIPIADLFRYSDGVGRRSMLQSRFRKEMHIFPKLIAVSLASPCVGQVHRLPELYIDQSDFAVSASRKWVAGEIMVRQSSI
jgi:hypothetical protein